MQQEVECDCSSAPRLDGHDLAENRSCRTTRHILPFNFVGGDYYGSLVQIYSNSSQILLHAIVKWVDSIAQLRGGCQIHPPGVRVQSP